MPDGCLPNFFIIGGPKCGSSSLHFYLDQHPQISMSSVKEPCVFADPRWFPSYESYEGMFDCEALLRGEASTAYSRYPVEGDAAPRIKEAVPDARLIYLIREPLDRIVSDYLQLVAVGVERREINEALREYEDPDNIYVSASRYGTQIDRFLEHFDETSLLVLEQADLRKQREETIKRTFSFLGADPDFSSPNFEAEIWTRQDHVRHESLAWKLRMSVFGTGFRKLPVRLRLPISRGARRLLRGEPNAEIESELRSELIEFLGPDIERVRAVTGRPLDGWLQPEIVASPS